MKAHFIVPGGATACGVPYPTNYSSDPQYVTCPACKRAAKFGLGPKPARRTLSLVHGGRAE